jgi:hypothetical protein
MAAGFSEIIFLHAVIDVPEQVHAGSPEPVPVPKKFQTDKYVPWKQTRSGQTLRSERIPQGADEKIRSPIYLQENGPV